MMRCDRCGRVSDGECPTCTPERRALDAAEWEDMKRRGVAPDIDRLLGEVAEAVAILDGQNITN